MRALAHRTRLDILGHLQHHGSATATECAKAVGASPSACSYHLRTLAKYGFVAEAEAGNGRERPWQALVAGFSWPSPAPAGAALREVVLERALELVARYFAREAEEPAEWREASIFSQSQFEVTLEEMVEIKKQVMATVWRHHARGKRDQPDVRMVQLLTIGVPAEPPVQ